MYSKMPQEPDKVVTKQKLRTKRRRDDLMWKGILEDVSADFLRFFFPGADELFDMDRQFEYLDKEFDQFFSYEEDNTGSVRCVDKLIKVFLKGGGEKWIAIHVEVQGQRGERRFE